MKSILVDMDGVLADVYNQFLKNHKEEFGQQLSIQDIAGLLEAKAFPNQIKYVTTPGFFRTVPVMPDSQQILKRLNENYKVYIVSMATEFPQSLTDKQLWLNDHFPFIGWQQMIFCGCKDIIRADIMIDDHLKNLDNFNGDTILFTQPHNLNLTSVRHKRVDSWIEIEKILWPYPGL